MKIKRDNKRHSTCPPGIGGQLEMDLHLFSGENLQYEAYFSSGQCGLISAGFFLTPAAEKTKTQGQNSSKKLKEKTQPLGGRSLPYAKLKKKN